MLLRAFSKSIGGDFKRIQFTPDLLPSDLTGINFYNQKQGEFEFRRGPLFSNIVLADEKKNWLDDWGWVFLNPVSVMIVGYLVLWGVGALLGWEVEP